MKISILTISMLLVYSAVLAQWKPVGDNIMTRWGKQVTTTNVLPEYPRPQIERAEWSNLNGLWEYAIRPIGEIEPSAFDGNILVPFAIESQLSGVQKKVGKDKELWYRRSFSIPSSWKGRNVVLNFGAVDWKCEVYINDIIIGKHQGGYSPFSFDITPYLKDKGEQKISLRVYDPTEAGICPRGKQTSTGGDIWYTSVTGIWQTVWIEPVNEDYITSLKAVPNLQTSMIEFTAETSCPKLGDVVTIEILENGKVISSAKGTPHNMIRVFLPDPKLWSPSNPYLYDVKVTLSNKSKVIDEFKSYTAMRKVSSKRDENGYFRIALNDTCIFNYGTLDQGWWPDGLYTAPSDEALAYDIIKTKEMGFNMIRKHVKVEPARWYYHCDRLGILVWQDMPSATGGVWEPDMKVYGKTSVYSDEKRTNFYNEWKEIMNLCYSNPSVIVWVPFNEGWGQFDTEAMASFTKSYDSSRLVDPTSGWVHRDCGDITDCHIYPAPKLTKLDPKRITVIGEYGGIGMTVEGHSWLNVRHWGYTDFKSADEVTDVYVDYANTLKQLAKQGISGAVYTQITDVEGESNGLMTYDRELIKVNVERIKEANTSVINFCK